MAQALYDAVVDSSGKLLSSDLAKCLIPEAHPPPFNTLYAGLSEAEFAELDKDDERSFANAMCKCATGDSGSSSYLQDYVKNAFDTDGPIPWETGSRKYVDGLQGESMLLFLPIAVMLLFFLIDEWNKGEYLMMWISSKQKVARITKYWWQVAAKLVVPLIFALYFTITLEEPGFGMSRNTRREAGDDVAYDFQIAIVAVSWGMVLYQGYFLWCTWKIYQTVDAAKETGGLKEGGYRRFMNNSRMFISIGMAFVVLIFSLKPLPERDNSAPLKSFFVAHFMLRLIPFLLLLQAMMRKAYNDALIKSKLQHTVEEAAFTIDQTTDVRNKSVRDRFDEFFSNKMVYTVVTLATVGVIITYLVVLWETTYSGFLLCTSYREGDSNAEIVILIVILVIAGILWFWYGLRMVWEYRNIDSIAALEASAELLSDQVQGELGEVMRAHATDKRVQLAVQLQQEQQMQMQGYTGNNMHLRTPMAPAAQQPNNVVYQVPQQQQQNIQNASNFLG